jgi:hypothetical protein
MKALEIFVVVLIVVGLIWYFSRYVDLSKNNLSDMFQGTPYIRGEGIVKCKANIGDYYYDKYRDRQRYQPLSTDARDYNELMTHKAALTHQDMWNKKMNESMKNGYVDNKGNQYGSVSKKLVTNAGLNNGKRVRFNQIDDSYSSGHEAMTDGMTVRELIDLVRREGFSDTLTIRDLMEREGLTDRLTIQDLMRREGLSDTLTIQDLMRREGMTNTDKNAPLSVNDLLPDPCLNNGKDWTNVFTECENLVGGQNFVRFEDEHFTNQVSDTRCTKLMNLDLRRAPPVQYADVSIWNKPSVCKNIFEYIRPSLDC